MDGFDSIVQFVVCLWTVKEKRTKAADENKQ